MSEKTARIKEHIIKETLQDIATLRSIWSGVDIILNRANAFGYKRPSATEFAQQLPELLHVFDPSEEVIPSQDFGEVVPMLVDVFVPSFFADIANDPDYNDVSEQIVSRSIKSHPLAEAANRSEVPLTELSLDEYVELWFWLRSQIWG